MDAKHTWQVAETGRLQALVREALGCAHSQARDAIRTGKILRGTHSLTDPGLVVRAGTTLQYVPNAMHPDRAQPMGVRLVYRDEDILVVDKPAGLLSVPLPRGKGPDDEKSALHAAQELCKGPRRPKAVHRLDKLTSGLLVFARSVQAARALRAAFDAQEVTRLYRCVVSGNPSLSKGTITSLLLDDRGDGRRGSKEGSFHVQPAGTPYTHPTGPGQFALTHYEVIAREGDYAAIQLRLETGRTHQIRIHMAELGCPVLGEAVYGGRQTLDEAPRQALHAAVLALKHPVTGQMMRFESPWPLDLAPLRPKPSAWWRVQAVQSSGAVAPEGRTEEPEGRAEEPARSGPGAVRSGPGVAKSGPGAARSGAGASRSGPGAVRSGPSAARSGAGAAKSGPGAARSGPGAHRGGSGRGTRRGPGR